MDVYESVYEANKARGRTPVTRAKCSCGNDQWYVRHGVDSRYESQFNPGEYVEFTCTGCGFSYEEQS